MTTQQAYSVKQLVASSRISGQSTYPEQEVDALLSDFDRHGRIETLFFSPDIDGCVENLQLAECTSGHDQSETLSYVLLEELREELIERVPHDELGQEMFNRKVLPGGEYNGTSIFLTL